MQRLLSLALFILLAINGMSNNIKIDGEAKVVGFVGASNDTAIVEFNVSWENSWRDDFKRYLLASKGGISNENIAKNEELINIINDLVEQHPKEYILENMDRITDENLPDSLKKDESIRKVFQQGVKQLMTPELKSLMAWDPSEILPQIKCNVLAIGGNKDLQIPAALNLNHLQSQVKKRVTTKIYPGLNHLFQHCTTGLPNEYAQIDETISPEVLNDIATWIINNNK